MGIIEMIRGWFGGQARESDPPLLAESAGPSTPAEDPAAGEDDEADVAVDFPSVLEAAGVSAEQRERVHKAQELLRTLPEETPATVKRQIVEAALRAFDVPIQKIIEAASSEMKALEGFVEAGETETARVRSEGETKIAKLNAEVSGVRAAIARALERQAARAAATDEELQRVQPVLRFFVREAIAAVVSDVKLEAKPEAKLETKPPAKVEASPSA